MIEQPHGAFLGAAVGDALGWPNEDRASRVRNEGATAVVRSFQRWIRRSGGRYFLHEDVILAGAYSDDTQLLLCTARSLLRGHAWWQHLATCEVPLWTLYERGGGGPQSALPMRG
jgi:ADP-ribosylglycohydrolase